MLALMGHMRRAMLQRYSPIRMAAKGEALAAITLPPASENSAAAPAKVPEAARAGQVQ
jgi:hypothetical protein